jgi:hypothetical protein
MTNSLNSVVVDPSCLDETVEQLESWQQSEFPESSLWGFGLKDGKAQVSDIVDRWAQSFLNGEDLPCKGLIFFFHPSHIVVPQLGYTTMVRVGSMSKDNPEATFMMPLEKVLEIIRPIEEK